MLRLRSYTALVATGALALTMFETQAQTTAPYPSKPLRIVTGGVGTNSELVSRVVGSGLQEVFGQPVIIDSRGGALSMLTVVKSPPDGYTLLLQGSGVWLSPLMRNNAGWDALRDFAPITMVSSSPSVFVVHPSLPVKTVKDLIALAKAKPGSLNYGSGNIGSVSHLGPELFKTMAGVNIVRVGYKGSGAALTALMTGEVQLTISGASVVSPMVKAGRVRAIAVADAQRTAMAPGLPTVAESGLPGYEAASLAGLFVPAKTPDAIIRRLHQVTVQVLNRADIKEKFATMGAEAVGNSPEEAFALLKGEVTRLGKVIKDAGIRED